jgi:transcriptional regulator with XRE-family HTH domain
MVLKTQLQTLMAKQGITAAELARRAGVSKQVLSLWLGGSEPRRITQVQKVARVLGVSIETLCFGDAQPTPTDAPAINIERLIGDQWISGLFEIRLRRVTK